MDELYQEIILDHGQRPRNVGQLSAPTVTVEYGNASCGDTIHIECALDGEGKISEVAWSGEGCVMSRASASLLSEWLVGHTLSEAQALTLEDLQTILGLPTIAPGRVKCVLLPVAALQHIRE